MGKYVTGKLREIIYAQLDPKEDLLQGIETVVVEREIGAGIVLSVTGALAKARLSYFPHPGPMESTPVSVHEVAGPMEASGHGIIGIREDGSPYIHVHLSVMNGEATIMGHLERGTQVRSLLPKSHFTIILAAVEGVSLRVLDDAEWSERYPDRFPLGALYHDLTQL